MGQQLKDALRSRISAQALAHFAERSYHEASLKDLAAAAGCSVGNLYRYFPDKLSLYRSLISDPEIQRIREALLSGMKALAGRALDAKVLAEGTRQRELAAFLAEHREKLLILVKDPGILSAPPFSQSLTHELLAALDSYAASLGKSFSPCQKAVLRGIYERLVAGIGQLLAETGDQELPTQLETLLRYHLSGMAGIMEAAR